MKTNEELIERLQHYRILSGKEKLNLNAFITKASLVSNLECLVNFIKSELHFYILYLWRNSNYIGVVEAATGIGKSRIGVLACCEFLRRSNYTEKVLISVSKEVLRDINWPNEIKKWGYEDCSMITIECHDTSRNRSGEWFDTLVIDEAHRILTPENIKLITNNNYKRIILLTATLNTEKRNLLKRLNIPIIIKYTLDDADKDGIISDHTRYVHYVELNDSERSQYEERTKDMDSAAKSLSGNKLERELEDHTYSRLGLTRAQAALNGSYVIDNNPGKTKSLAAKYIKSMGMRKNILYFSIEKIKFIELFITEYLKDGKLIVFSLSSEFVDALYKYFTEVKNIQHISKYHSKLKKEKKVFLDDFIKGKSNVMLSAKALNEGLDVDDINYAIAASGDSSNLDQTQREGRAYRYLDGKHAIFINLVCRGTVEVGWFQASISKRERPIELKKIDDIWQQNLKED